MLHPDYGTARERTRYRGITWETYETTSQQYLSICKYCFYVIRQERFKIRFDYQAMNYVTMQSANFYTKCHWVVD